MARLMERINQTQAEITIDWDLKSVFIRNENRTTAEYEFTGIEDLAAVLLNWLEKECAA